MEGELKEEKQQWIERKNEQHIDIPLILRTFDAIAHFRLKGMYINIVFMHIIFTDKYERANTQQ